MKTLVSTEQINHRTEEIAAEIISDYDNRDTSVLFVSLLRGAAPFTSKLMFEITRQSPDFHPELDYMMISTYADGRVAGEPKIVTDLPPTTSVEGRDVIVIDDVLDKGITANFAARYLRERGAIAVKLCVLAQKATEMEQPIVADYCGFELPDKWLVGMGMDDASTQPEAYRWLEKICSIS